MSSTRVVVCGAGWAGLNAARILQSRNVEVVVLEKSDRVGGRITSDAVDGFTLDRGFQVINPAYAELRETGALNGIEFNTLPKGVDLRLGMASIRVGDFRGNLSYLPGCLSKDTGSIREKLAFINYLRRATEEVDLEEALATSGEFFTRVLKPFLDGVFLTDSNKVPSRVARELIHWFIKGAPGVPSGGVRQASEALASGLDVRFGVEVTGISTREVVTNEGVEKADAVILACDPVSASRFLQLQTPRMNSSTTWYFSISKDEIESAHLRFGGVGPIVNSIVISNVAESYAPRNRALLQATTITRASESDLRAHLSYLWECDTKDWELITKYEISDSLPFQIQGQPLVAGSAQLNGIYIAGDWRSTPSQQGALLSGRLAANAVIADR